MIATAAEANTLNGTPGLREVDAAVRSVLAEIRRSRARPTSRPGLSSEVFAGGLFSLRHAEGLAAGAREVRVTPGTVVTPLAYDFLKKAGVTVRWVSRVEAEGLRTPGEWAFTIDDEIYSGRVEPLRRWLLDDKDAWGEIPGGLDAAMGWVAGADARGAFVLAAEASTAVYRACRADGVRAASAVDVESAARAVRALGVNVLVVEPAGKPIGLLRQIGAAFRRGGAPAVPGWLAESQGVSP